MHTVSFGSLLRADFCIMNILVTEMLKLILRTEKIMKLHFCDCRRSCWDLRAKHRGFPFCSM
jgi:hypothetical protein